MISNTTDQTQIITYQTIMNQHDKLESTMSLSTGITSPEVERNRGYYATHFGNLRVQKLQLNFSVEEILAQDIEQPLPLTDIEFTLRTNMSGHIENFLRSNRNLIKLIAPRKQKVFLTNQTHVETKKCLVHCLHSSPIHLYTNYLPIEENIKRIETVDQLFNYNFTQQMKDQFKMDILASSRNTWRSELGGLQMCNILGLYTLPGDTIQQYALYLYLIPIELRRTLLQNPNSLTTYMKSKQFMNKYAELKLKINLNSLEQIIINYAQHMISQGKQNIIQRNPQIKHSFEIHKLSQLSYKSFQNDKFINPDQAYLCINCLEFNGLCKCYSRSKISGIYQLISFHQASEIVRSNRKRKPITKWAIDQLEYMRKHACNKKCYKLNHNDISLSESQLLGEDEQLEIVDDPCIMAKQLSVDCRTIYIQAQQNMSAIINQYLECISNLQNNIICPYPCRHDYLATLNDPRDAAFLNQPCSHKYDQQCKDCQCKDNSLCTKYCECNKKLCKLKHSGCECQGICDDDCLCVVSKIECDPLICKCCKSHSITCCNMRILINDKQPMWYGRSSVCPGLGVFAKNIIPTGALVTLYCGELLHEDDDEIRDEFDNVQSFYGYELLDSKFSLEARFCGNEARFINHSIQNSNCEAVQYFAQGKYQLAIFARKTIHKQEELLLNYDQKNKLDIASFPWITSNEKYFNYYQDIYICK